MARLADGDRSSFGLVYRTLWPEVRRLCMALLKNAADADDVAQQSMEKILSRASEYDSERPARPWALGIATWECRTHRRKQFRRREHALTTESIDQPGHRDDSVEEQAIQGDLVNAALEALQELTPSDRDVLVSTYWEHAAEAPALAGATLRKRRERALSRLRNTFRRLYGFG
jgi:RNA polymerase sigma-70 factor (ECF subfamily)